MAENKVIYFDNNATTRIAPEVFEAMTPYLTEYYGNPSSIHHFGGQVMEKVDEAKASLAALLGADPANVIFTSCGTESDNAAIFSALLNCPKRKKIVVSTVEHPAVLSLAKELERRGNKVSRIPVDSNGVLDMNAARELIDDETAIVSVMWANNETGNIQDVETLAEIAHKNGALFHTDAVQAVGKIPIDLKNSAIDMLSLSGHKLHGPKGIGALYVKRGVRFRPYIIGGHQENGRRAGTENVASIIGLGKAAELALQNIEKENTFVASLRRLPGSSVASCKSRNALSVVVYRRYRTCHMCTVVMGYDLLRTAYEIEAAGIISSEILMLGVNTSVNDSDDYIRISGSITFPYRNHIDIRTCSMALVKRPVVEIMPLLRKLRIIENRCIADIPYRFDYLDSVDGSKSF